MSRFFCHLYGPDEFFPDTIGWDVSDLAAAHKRAVMFAERVMMISELADHEPDWRRWKLQIVDDNSRRVMTVILSSCCVHIEQTHTHTGTGGRPRLAAVAQYLATSGGIASPRDQDTDRDPKPRTSATAMTAGTCVVNLLETLSGQLHD
jgi:hypothetical protein